MKFANRPKRAAYTLRWLDALAGRPDGRGPRTIMSRWLIREGQCRSTAYNTARYWAEFAVTMGFVCEVGEPLHTGAHPTKTYQLTDAGYAAVLHDTLEVA
jgi:hypothetical protein